MERSNLNSSLSRSYSSLNFLFCLRFFRRLTSINSELFIPKRLGSQPCLSLLSFCLCLILQVCVASLPFGMYVCEWQVGQRGRDCPAASHAAHLNFINPISFSSTPTRCSNLVFRSSLYLSDWTLPTNFGFTASCLPSANHSSDSGSLKNTSFSISIGNHSSSSVFPAEPPMAPS